MTQALGGYVSSPVPDVILMPWRPPQASRLHARGHSLPGACS